MQAMGITPMELDTIMPPVNVPNLEEDVDYRKLLYRILVL